MSSTEDGSLRLSTPNSATREVLLPINTTLSIEHSEGLDAIEDVGKEVEERSTDDPESGNTYILEILHVQRSPIDIYQLRVAKSALKFAKLSHMKSVLEAVETGIGKVSGGRPKKMLVRGRERETDR